MCHQINAVGGRLGPDLSRIGLARSVESLERRIRGDYGRMVDPTFAPTTLTAASGESMQGVKKKRRPFLYSGHRHGWTYPGLQEG